MILPVRWSRRLPGSRECAVLECLHLGKFGGLETAKPKGQGPIRGALIIAVERLPSGAYAHRSMRTPPRRHLLRRY